MTSNTLIQTHKHTFVYVYILFHFHLHTHIYIRTYFILCLFIVLPARISFSVHKNTHTDEYKTYRSIANKINSNEFYMLL